MMLKPAGWSLTFTLGGRARFRSPSGASFQATGGDLVLLEPEAAVGRGVLREDGWDAFGLVFEPWQGWEPSGFLRVADGLHRTHIAHPRNRQRVLEALQRIVIDLNARDTARILGAVAAERRLQDAWDEVIDTKLVSLRLREIFLLAARESSTAPHLDPRIRTALQAMERDLARPPTMRQLAALAGLSYTRFAHLFKSQLGVTPKRVQRLIRLGRAAIQLEYGDDPIGVIADQFGFASIFDFSREFRREYGMSPSAYRAEHR